MSFHVIEVLITIPTTVALMLLNCFSVRWMARIATGITVIKIFAGLLVVVLGFVQLILKGG